MGHLRRLELAAKKLKEPEFTLEQVNAIGDFQEYGGSIIRKGKQVDIIMSDVWPTKFRSYNKPLYRLIGLPKKQYKNIRSNSVELVNKYKLSSWSKDYKIAKDFINEMWFGEFNANKIPVIIRIAKANKCLDIEALHRHKPFIDSIEYYFDHSKNVSSGIDIGAGQKEVIVFSEGATTKIDIIEYGDEKLRKWVKL